MFQGKQMRLYKTGIIFIAVIVLFGCTKQQAVDLSTFTQTTTVDSDIYLRSLSAKVINDSVRLVYGDERTQTLKYAEVTSSSSQCSYIDKVDTVEKYNSCLGYHNYVVTDKAEYLVYEEYKSQKDMYFKVLNRKFGKSNWTVDIISINCSTFNSFGYDNNLFIMYPTEHNITIKQYDSGLASVAYKDDDNAKAFDLKIVPSNEPQKKFVYYTDNNALYEKTINISKSTKYSVECIATRHIDNNVKLYDTFVDINNRSNLIYYNEGKHALYLALADSEPVLMGYFANLYCINSVVINDKVYFIVSTTKTTQDNQINYELALIYIDKNGDYQESSLLKTDLPISIMTSVCFDNNIYMIYGYTELSISKINTDIITRL